MFEFSISGLDELQRNLEGLANAAESLDGELAEVRFNPHDPASVEAAITEAERAIEAKLAPYSSNPMVEEIGGQLKEQFRQTIYEKAAEARAGQKGEVMNVSPQVLRQIDNTVSDLRSTEYNTFDGHLKKLSRLLHGPELEPITSTLTAGIDLDAWMKEQEATQGGMVGSATIEWPHDHDKDLGTRILLIDYFAKQDGASLGFSHTFYNAGTRLTDNLQRMAREVILPFARDYRAYHYFGRLFVNSAGMGFPRRNLRDS